MSLLRQRMIEAMAICTIAVEARHTTCTPLLRDEAQHRTEAVILLTTASKEIWVR